MKSARIPDTEGSLKDFQENSGGFPTGVGAFVLYAVAVAILVVVPIVGATQPEEIKVIQDGSRMSDGLSILLQPDPEKPPSDESLHFLLKVINLLPDDVFLTVTGFENVSFTLRHSGVRSGDFRIYSSGSAQIVRPDNTELLKRLHGRIGVNDKGEIVTCGCCGAALPLSISMPGEASFSEWAGKSGILLLNLHGYFRSSGREFRTAVEVPFVVPDAKSATDSGKMRR